MFIKTTFNSDLNHILNCVNKCDFGTKCFAKVEHFVLRLIDGNSLLDISLQYGLNGMVPRVFMNDPSNSDVLYFRPDSMVVEQKGSDGYIYQTQIMGGRIIMVKGSEIVWDQNMLPK